MPYCATLEQALLGYRFGKVAYVPPATDYVGLIATAKWAPNVAVAAGSYIIGSAFASTNAKIYVCTTPGTTGGAEPTWDQTAGATTADGTAVWTETSLLFSAGSFTGAEPTDTAYARQPITNDGTHWTAVSGSNPASVSNAELVQFPESTEAWNWIAGWFTSTLAAAGTPQTWGVVNVSGQGALLVGSAGIGPNFDPGALINTLD